MTLLTVAGCAGIWPGEIDTFSVMDVERTRARHFKRNCTRDQSEPPPSPKDMSGFIYTAESIYKQRVKLSVSNTLFRRYNNI